MILKIQYFQDLSKIKKSEKFIKTQNLIFIKTYKSFKYRIILEVIRIFRHVYIHSWNLERYV